jgi:hypothetical protein
MVTTFPRKALEPVDSTLQALGVGSGSALIAERVMQPA